jgi:hypothetical protein
MQFKIIIDCDNAAFVGATFGPELARILRSIACDVEVRDRNDDDLHFCRSYNDINCNKVAKAELFD